MKFLLSCLFSLMTVVTFAQDVSPSKPLTISFDQLKKASTLQELAPTYFGELKDVVSYKAVVAISRQKLTTIDCSGNAIHPKIKELILAQKDSGTQILLYINELKYGTEKTYQYPAKILSIK